ncbi:GM25544 [Drosophila sechellia]|uniref:GM25544 n=1 Tax=Drosophila sechellia TaxID=7238 RepID=B4HIG8_DROSE|nr:GM25544 [Drosophila sechellia]
MSDDEEHYEPKAHKKLLQAIGSLGKVQHIQKSTRDERQSRQDEFQLVKGVSSAETDNAPRAVGLNDLVDILRTSTKHSQTGKKLKSIQGSKKVLEKPLEKPAADRIKRTIGYEGVTKKLGRWDAVVAQQRSAETQIFPLPSETVYVNTSANARPLNTRVKSNLAQELEANNRKLRELRKAEIGDTTDEKELAKQERFLLQKKLTRDELFARRKELAYLKMRESQKSAKARMQNKIKSKKFHKLQKRQKMLEQMKEFELLQKTNPEAALEKLNALEKSRVQERASLRHKNTGTWAKNLQIRAKYDKDVRKDLAEQLAVSRELTQKKQESDSEDETIKKTVVPEEEENDYDPFNPWTKRRATEQTENGKGESEDANWRQYWTKRNKNEKLLEEHRRDLVGVQDNDEQEEKETIQKPLTEVKPAKKKLKKSKVKIENGWQVEDISPTDKKEAKERPNSKAIDDIFEKHGDQIRAKLSKDSELKNTELQLALPGWGSWAGAGISKEVMERRNKRLLLKLAAPETRRDENKDNLYINESASTHARQHMVSSIPFPFRSLADYEASIRAPVGRNFVPETAFRMLTRPAVITRKGQVIEPMTESELVKPDRRLRHIVDRRIKRIPKVPPKAKIA